MFFTKCSTRFLTVSKWLKNILSSMAMASICAAEESMYSCYSLNVVLIKKKLCNVDQSLVQHHWCTSCAVKKKMTILESTIIGDKRQRD